MKPKETLSKIFEDRFTGVVYIILVIFFLLSFFSFINRFFDRDEFEHIHSAWYAARGYVPYVDFFQPHHPLLWFLLAPLIRIFGESVIVLHIGRMFMFGFMIAGIYLVFRITRLITGSKEVGLIAAVLLLSNVGFVQKGIEVRPDVPQVFFCLLSVYYLVHFLKHKKRGKDIILSGLFASIAFLFLQKTLFLLLAYLPVFIYKLYKRELSLKYVALFTLSFILPLLSLTAYLVLNHSLPEYILTNWLVPARLIGSFSPHYTIVGLVIENFLFWFFLVFAVIIIFFKLRAAPAAHEGAGSSVPVRDEEKVSFPGEHLPGISKKGAKSKKESGFFKKFSLRIFKLRKTVNSELALITFIAVLSFLLPTSLVRLPYKQNYMLAIALCAVPAAYCFKFFCFWQKFKKKGKIGLLTATVFLPFIILTIMLSLPTQGKQVAKINYVLENTTPADYVYDGNIDFNLFRKDMHYFWFGLLKNKEFATYNKLTGNKKYGDYDIYSLISEKKPKFISDTRLSIEKRALRSFYKKTEFKGLYIKVE